MKLFFKNFIVFNLCLAALGLPCCTQAFFSCSERGYSLVVVCRLLVVVASLAVEHRL